MTYHELDQFTRSYIETALWSSTDESTPQGGEPMDSNYGPGDIAEETLKKMASDCQHFQEQNAETMTLEECRDASRCGHDFWLTRNGHGAGFWDGDYPKAGDKLTEASKRFGEVNLYIGDDGKVYQL